MHGESTRHPIYPATDLGIWDDIARLQRVKGECVDLGTASLLVCNLIALASDCCVQG